MKKFFVLYRVPVETMQDWKADTSPEEMQAQGKKMGEEMQAWMQKYASSITDKGLPLGKNTRMTASGAEAVTNDLNYYYIVEAESLDDVIAMFKENAHLQMIPNSFIDIMEVSSPGM
jgi:hypothetical protein